MTRRDVIAVVWSCSRVLRVDAMWFPTVAKRFAGLRLVFGAVPYINVDITSRAEARLMALHHANEMRCDCPCDSSFR